MTYAATLLRAEIRAVGALLVVVLFLALGVAAFELFTRGAFPNRDAASRDLIRIAVVGTLFVSVYGAPLYALAVCRGVGSWYAAAAIGLAPAVTLLPFLWAEPGLTFAIGACGLAVALLTHLSTRSNSALLTDAYSSPLRAQDGAA